MASGSTASTAKARRNGRSVLVVSHATGSAINAANAVTVALSVSVRSVSLSVLPARTASRATARSSLARTTR
jgi:hypothetical protein